MTSVSSPDAPSPQRRLSTTPSVADSSSVSATRDTSVGFRRGASPEVVKMPEFRRRPHRVVTVPDGLTDYQRKHYLGVSS